MDQAGQGLPVRRSVYTVSMVTNVPRGAPARMTPRVIIYRGDVTVPLAGQEYTVAENVTLVSLALTVRRHVTVRIACHVTPSQENVNVK